MLFLREPLHVLGGPTPWWCERALLSYAAPRWDTYTFVPLPSWLLRCGVGYILLCGYMTDAIPRVRRDEINDFGNGLCRVRWSPSPLGVTHPRKIAGITKIGVSNPNFDMWNPETAWKRPISTNVLAVVRARTSCACVQQRLPCTTILQRTFNIHGFKLRNIYLKWIYILCAHPLPRQEPIRACRLGMRPSISQVSSRI